MTSDLDIPMIPPAPLGSRAGFTLVETMAVIGIIVVLMSIAIPTLHSIFINY